MLEEEDWRSSLVQTGRREEEETVTKRERGRVEARVSSWRETGVLETVDWERGSAMEHQVTGMGGRGGRLAWECVECAAVAVPRCGEGSCRADATGAT